MRYTGLILVAMATLLPSHVMLPATTTTSMPRYALRLPFSPAVVGLALGGYVRGCIHDFNQIFLIAS